MMRKSAVLALVVIMAASALVLMGASNGYQEVSFADIQHNGTVWQLWPSTCDKKTCKEKFGTYGKDQSIYIKAKLIAVKGKHGNYRLDRAARKRIQREDSYISVVVLAPVYKAELVAIRGGNILVFEYDIDNEDNLCLDGSRNEQERKALKARNGIGLTRPDQPGCGPPTQMLGGETYMHLWHHKSQEWVRYQVDKTKTGITDLDPKLDWGKCIEPKRKARRYDLPVEVYNQCRDLLFMARELTGINWSKDVPISEWDGVKRVDVGRGRVVSVDLDTAVYAVAGKVHERGLLAVLGPERRPVLDLLRIKAGRWPDTEPWIEHRREWEPHTHSLAVDGDGYVLCYYKKCDAEGRPFMPE